MYRAVKPSLLIHVYMVLIYLIYYDMLCMEVDILKVATFEN